MSRVLVVDDEPAIHRFLTPVLLAHDYEVLRADTSADALRLIAANPPDVIVLDLGLPDLDGKDVIARVRAWSDVPIVVLSAREREGGEDCCAGPGRGRLRQQALRGGRTHGPASGSPAPPDAALRRDAGRADRRA